jgi:hypothetical protein
MFRSKESSTTLRDRNGSSKKRTDRSHSANKRKDLGKYNNGLLASPYSPESIMTQNPVQIENIRH